MRVFERWDQVYGTTHTDQTLSRLMRGCGYAILSESVTGQWGATY